MKIEQIVEKQYKYFSELEGNDHISSIHALKCILKLINDFKVKSVLELGLGIGSISDTILTYSKTNNKEIKYFGTEANEFCLNALKSNVKNYSEINLFSSVSSIDSSNKFDLIIVDGSDEGLKSIKNYCKESTLIFIEGLRDSQIKIIKDLFPNSIHVELISKQKNPKYGPFSSEKWSGGGQLIFINPDLKQKIYWFKEKVKTYIKRRIRKLI
jgi:hypothetical protein